MAKIPTELSPDENTPANGETTKPKRDYEVVDAQALYAKYPQLFKLVPDYAKIRAAMKIGLDMPGIALLPHHPDYVE